MAATTRAIVCFFPFTSPAVARASSSLYSRLPGRLCAYRPLVSFIDAEGARDIHRSARGEGEEVHPSNEHGQGVGE